ncbi:MULTISPECIES: hypothetical protein [unclassified Fusibacter]|uniref:hypothetical protein n=1 Tax=unclassified Fusibacter TaxID=2624464 RepID=UPI0010104FA8|nr:MULTISPECIES: hypothetical protein [unclassified Fusibacter]MCK8060797.1 hypothetical protein [Fusibacter sp. A2]NPE23093.1 hypothetical protein [Fusibacter sp. A1]RXV59763.1 hypothetical protein DWB64_14765 [Fusibacter sp. A1]
MRYKVSTMVLIVSTLLVGCASNLHNPNETLTTESQKNQTTPITTVLETEVESENPVETSSNKNENITSNLLDSNKIKVGEQGLNFTTSREEVFKLLGEPLKSEKAMGVVVYDFDGLRLAFIEEELAFINIYKSLYQAPYQIEVGESIIDISKKYGLPLELVTLGATDLTADDELATMIRNHNSSVYEFIIDDTYRFIAHIDVDSLKSDYFEIGRLEARKEFKVVELDDFSKDIKEISEKYGYPDDVYISGDSGLILSYTKPYDNITMLNDYVLKSNELYLIDDWICPKGIKAGTSVKAVLNILYDQNTLLDYGITSEMNNSEIITLITENNAYGILSFDEAEYSGSYRFNNDGDVDSLVISRKWIIDYEVPLTDEEFEVPEYDKDKFMDSSEMYFSNIGIGSTREDVFQTLGNPIYNQIGFDDFLGKYQICGFEKGEAYFDILSNLSDLSDGWVYTLVVWDPSLIGPRGLKIGESINRILELFPTFEVDDITSLNEEAKIYSLDDSNSYELGIWASPEEDDSTSGIIVVRIKWIDTFIIFYEKGIITKMALDTMLN